MSEHVYNVLFLCTGNSARSIMAEAILNKVGEGRFRAFSAGSNPKGEVNPFALRLLKELDFPTEGLRSKSWDEFAAPGAPVLDFVFTVCDNAAGEVCPAWPGQPMTAHWGIEDPAAVEGRDIEKEKAFVTAMRYLRNRIGVFINLPITSLDDLTLGKQLREIGRQSGARQPRPEMWRERAYGCDHLSQSGLRHIAQHPRADPQCRHRAAHDRISEDAAVAERCLRN